MAEPGRDPTTAAALARLYDLDLLEDPGDVDLYLALAARTGGPILEIAAGSGRLALPLARAGYEVTLVDIDPATRLIDPGLIEAAITDRTRAIIPVDLAGLPVNRDVLYELASRHDLRVIEDAAQSQGARWHAR